MNITIKSGLINLIKIEDYVQQLMRGQLNQAFIDDR
jgi:hypothetical protein